MSKILNLHGCDYNLNKLTLLNILLGFNSEFDREKEINKIQYIIDANLDVSIITDLSLSNVPANKRLWKYIVKETSFVAGTVPIYLARRKKDIISENSLIEDIHQQCEEGVGIITIHPTVCRELLLMSKTRVIPFTSRGGGIVANDLICSRKTENIYIRILNRIIEFAKINNTVISIGSSFRSGTIADANDLTYQNELHKQIKLAQFLENNGVHTIIETPGHVDPQNLHKICDIIKSLDIPIMPLGPFPTDIAFEEDDTAAVIGASLMGTYGCADILSVVTKEEHQGGVPSFASLIDAIKKYEVCKHIIDLYKNPDIEREKDYLVSKRRMQSKSCIIGEQEGCNRCGELCPLKSSLVKAEFNNFYSI